MTASLKNQRGMIDIMLIVVVFVAAVVIGGYIYYQDRQEALADTAAGQGITVASHPKTVKKPTSAVDPTTATQ